MGRVEDHVCLVAAKARWQRLVSHGNISQHGEACMVHLVNNDLVVLLNITGNPVLEDVLTAGTLDHALPVCKVFEDVPDLLQLLHLGGDVEGQCNQRGQPLKICDDLAEPASTLLKLGKQKLLVEALCMLSKVLKIYQPMARPGYSEGRNLQMVSQIIISHMGVIPESLVGHLPVVLNDHRFNLLKLAAGNIRPYSTGIHQPCDNQTVVELHTSFERDVFVVENGTLEFLIGLSGHGNAASDLRLSIGIHGKSGAQVSICCDHLEG